MSLHIDDEDRYWHKQEEEEDRGGLVAFCLSIAVCPYSSGCGHLSRWHLVCFL